MGAERSNGQNLPVSGDDGASQPRRHRRRRRWPWILLAIVAVVGARAAPEALTVVRMRDDLEAGRRSLEDARRSLLAGNVDQAASQFAQAGIHFGAAARTGHGPVGDLGAAVPGLGNTLDVARALAEAGGDLSAAGIDLTTDAFSRLPGGIDAPAPTRSRLPLDP